MRLSHFFIDRPIFAAVVSIVFVIVGAEFMGADAGLGHMIMEGRVFFNPAQIVMGALLLGALGSAVNALLLATERRVLGGRAPS